MRPPRGDDNALEEMSGQDSFLDIVANIVGILILLVVIVGIRAALLVPEEIARQAEQATAATSDDTPNGTADAEKPADSPPLPSSASALASDEPIVSDEQINELQQQAHQVAGQAIALSLKAAQLNAQANELDHARVALAAYIHTAEEELARRRQALEGEKQQELDLNIQLAKAEQQLDDLTRQQVALMSQAPPSKELVNVPTPIASRVEGEEIHLHLQQGRVVEVPMDELLNQLFLEAGDDVRRHPPSIDSPGRFGPVSGFYLHYAFLVKTILTPDGKLTNLHIPVLEFRPSHAGIGELVDDALQQQSQLQAVLDRYDRRKTAVTIWTYPDSFGQTNQLRQHLHQQGFPVAVRPLRPGSYIAQGPNGTASRAQ